MTILALSNPQLINLKVYRGDSGGFLVSFVNSAGAPIDVTGATWLSQIRDKPDGTIIATLNVAPQAADQILVSLSDTESKKLSRDGYWDLQMLLSGATSTPLYGQVLVTKDVSRT